MTQFDKTKFNFHGGYLTYTGTYVGRPVYEEGRNIHPSNVGRGKDLFIARFKYSGSPITKAKFLKELIKNFTIEEYVTAREGHNNAPTRVLDAKNPGWSQSIVNAWKEKRGMK
jgi:hypothetical protein|tara:strand:+ start:785 stop:1123 length:339 start_codon:yes stop_codon:yes gene_type:complete